MITAMTSARVKVANEMYEIGNKLRELRSYVCLSIKDVDDIDNAIHMADDIVNRVMKERKCN
jgi:hypothetical protein